MGGGKYKHLIQQQKLQKGKASLLLLVVPELRRSLGSPGSKKVESPARALSEECSPPRAL